MRTGDSRSFGTSGARWGFEPKNLDEEHNKRPLMIVAATGDPLGSHMPNWLKENYRNSTLTWLEGGHISAAYSMSALWAELFDKVEGPNWRLTPK